MKASNAASATLLVSAIQISCNDRLAFGCWLFGSLFRTLAVLCTQQRCSRVVGHSSPSAFQKPSAPSARDCQEFRAEVGHDRSKGARQCRDAKNPVFLTPFSI